MAGDPEDGAGQLSLPAPAPEVIIVTPDMIIDPQQAAEDGIGARPGYTWVFDITQKGKRTRVFDG